MAVPISNVTRRVVFSASGTGPYNFTFEILANTDVAVYKDDALLTLTTDYTVTINANGTGFITLVASPTGATQIAIVGNRTIQRTTDFVTGGDFFANTVNDEMDQQTIFAQQNAEGLQRALQAPQTDPTTIDMTLPRAAIRASKVLSFDANGNPSATEFIGSNRGNWASGTLYYVRDIIKDTSTSNIWQCVVEHTSRGAQPIGTNADAAKWFLLVDAASAGASATAAAASASAAATSATNAANSASAASTSATNAASSASTASTQASNASSSATAAASSASTASTAATNAGNSATAAATSATNASNSASSASTSATNASNSATSAASSASTATTQATNAANSASAASTSASNASTSATNAANSATNSASSATAAAASAAAAAASFDAFDDIYLGAKSSDPSVDNDGNALTTGDQYFNTSANELRVYNGSTWQAASTVGGTVTSLSVTGNTTLGDATADSVTVNAGTLNFAQTGQRITGDFSNATLANRVAFQTSTTNGPTQITAMPNGTSTQSQFTAVSGTDLNNANGVQIRATSTEAAVMAYNTGSASALPMTFYTGGSERMRVDTSGNVGIGTSSPATSLYVYRTATDAVGTFQGLQTSSGGTGKSAIQLDVNGKGGFAISNDATSGTRALTISNNSGYGVSTVEAMRIDSNGNVGIGTSSPTWKTTVVNGSTPRCLQLSQYATNNIDKYSFISAGHYTSSTYTDGFALIGGVGSSGANAVQIGGGIGETLASSVIQFYTAANNTTTVGTERMRIDSSGNVGIGMTPSGDSRLEVYGADSATIYKNSASGTGTSDGFYVGFGKGSSTEAYVYNRENAALIFGANNTERARIDSSGNLLVGTTSSAADAVGARLLASNQIQASKSGDWSFRMGRRDSTGIITEIYYNSSRVGDISTNGTGTSYNTSSDYRLKENIAPMTGALEKVQALKPCTYNWKADGSEGEGFIAHELQDVVPHAVTGEKDAVDADGNPVYQGIDTSFLVATLTAALQEAHGLIKDLQSRVDALEAK